MQSKVSTLSPPPPRCAPKGWVPVLSSLEVDDNHDRQSKDTVVITGRVLYKDPARDLTYSRGEFGPFIPTVAGGSVRVPEAVKPSSGLSSPAGSAAGMAFGLGALGVGLAIAMAPAGGLLAIVGAACLGGGSGFALSKVLDIGNPNADFPPMPSLT